MSENISNTPRKPYCFDCNTEVPPLGGPCKTPEHPEGIFFCVTCFQKRMLPRVENGEWAPVIGRLQ